MITNDIDEDASIDASNEASNDATRLVAYDDHDEMPDEQDPPPEDPEDPEIPVNPDNHENAENPESVTDEQVPELPMQAPEDRYKLPHEGSGRKLSARDSHEEVPLVEASRPPEQSVVIQDDDLSDVQAPDPVELREEPKTAQLQSLPASARSEQPSSRSNHATADTVDALGTEKADEMEDEPPERPTRVSAAFNAWESTEPGSAYTIGPFVLLLIEEFCRQYDLTETLAVLQQELHDLNVQVPDSELWFEMYSQCRSILGNKKHSSPQASATTIEKLVEFCVNPLARRAVFSLDMASAHSPVNFSSSPKKGSSSGTSAFSLLVAYNQIRSPIVRPSQRPSNITTDGRSIPVPELKPEADGDDGVQHNSGDIAESTPPDASPTTRPHPSPLLRNSSMLTSVKKKKKRKVKQQRSQSIASTHSYGSPQRDHGYGTYQVAAASPAPGTYGEPVLVDAHRTDLKRDLMSTRLLEKELRKVRIEKISTEPKKPIQKRLGFCSLTAEEKLERKKLQDPYASELVMEKYGFSKRQDCALCHFPFLMYNLPHKVSFKCVMDVYDHWNYVPPDMETAAKYKAPLCYDVVHVCRMCAQIVFQHAKQPESKKLLEAAPRPLSRKHKKAKSLANLHQEKPEDDSTFCSDPYALPPLLGDDVYDQPEALTRYYNTRRTRVGGLRGDDLNDDPRAGMSEFPAKAIIYSQQMESARFMSSKEWDVINPDKSSTRHILEATLRR